MASRIKSLEVHLAITLVLCVLLPIVHTMLLLKLPLWLAVPAMILLSCPFAMLLLSLYRRSVAIFRRASTQFEALQAQDYALRAKSPYEGGQVAEFQQHLDALAESLQSQKSTRDRQSLLLYRLLDQLNTPILLFDQRLLLSYGNPAFTTLFGRPWETLRNASPALLGLAADPEWQFVDQHKAQQWQIRQSVFLDQGLSHQLLVFIDIQAALREGQLKAWQKLMQVMSHEIRNSLTPVVALVQNLLVRADNPRDRQALQLIDGRCHHLQDFVKRYAELHKAFVVRPEWLAAALLFEQLAPLFPDARLHAVGQHVRLWADPLLLQQVLINLVKNALEAGSPPGTIRIAFMQGTQHCEIRVQDRGCGIASPENLFVPFYSTKAQGQGIGLHLSRHCIEQMGGQLTLNNNVDSAGACALIYLSQPSRSAKCPLSNSTLPEPDADASLGAIHGPEN